VAAHALDGGRFPLEGAILLSPDADDRGLLRARQLLEHDYRNLRLVVLAGCRTSGHAVSGGEGLVGLAWPFLAGGAEAVVATLWQVDDRATSRLLPRFHAAYARTGRAAAALRQAQVEALRNGAPPHEWAGVISFSGDA
jgi:CHAT domain-containing protein